MDNRQRTPIALVQHDGDFSGWLLGLDTSTGQTGIALTNGTSVLELSLPGGREQTRSVLPEIDWLLQRLQVHRDQIGAVAVATGPGSFTGLRVGLSIGKGFALASNAAVIGVPTLDIVTRPYRMSNLPVMAVLPAGRSRLVWEIHEANGDHATPRNGTLAELLETLMERSDVLVVGELDEPVWQEIAAKHPRIEARLLGTRRAAALVEIGYQRWIAGDVDDATTLEPVYLHGQQTALPPRSQR